MEPTVPFLLTGVRYCKQELPMRPEIIQPGDTLTVQVGTFAVHLTPHIYQTMAGYGVEWSLICDPPWIGQTLKVDDGTLVIE
jgi:hypothetical protein